MSGLDQAAAAFDLDLGNAPKASAPAGEENSSVSVEDVFPHLNTNEGGEEGEEDVPPKKDKAKPEPEDEDDEEGGEEGGEGDEDKNPDADDEDADEPDDFLDSEVEVMVDGEPKVVSVREAARGYMREQTFHQRLNQLDHVVKGVNTKGAEVEQLHADYTAMLSELEEQIKALVVEPDWDKLYEQDPKGARALQKQYEQFATQRSAIKAEQARVANEAAERTAKEKAAFGQTELRKFIEVNPQWKTPQDMGKELTQMHKTASELGFSQEEIKDVLDSRMLRVLQKAARYDRMMANKPKAVDKSAKSVSPGAVRKAAPKEMMRAKKNHARAGTVESAASVFANMISQER